MTTKHNTTDHQEDVTWGGRGFHGQVGTGYRYILGKIEEEEEENKKPENFMEEFIEVQGMKARILHNTVMFILASKEDARNKTLK